jgi:hypothetical protein
MAEAAERRGRLSSPTSRARRSSSSSCADGTRRCSPSTSGSSVMRSQSTAATRSTRRATSSSLRSRARDAVLAAVEAQRAGLPSTTGRRERSVRVRIGIHTGQAPADGRYSGVGRPPHGAHIRGATAARSSSRRRRTTCSRTRKRRSQEPSSATSASSGSRTSTGRFGSTRLRPGARAGVSVARNGCSEPRCRARAPLSASPDDPGQRARRSDLRGMSILDWVRESKVPANRGGERRDSNPRPPA